MSITAEEPMILPSLTFLLELFGVFASPSHLTVPDTVIVSPCFLFLMTSGRAAGGVYLKGRDIDVVSFITELLCMNIMPLGTTRRLDIVMGCCACCSFVYCCHCCNNYCCYCYCWCCDTITTSLVVLLLIQFCSY